jgi:hypothetical protein
MEKRSCGEEDAIKTFGGAARTVSLNGACRAAGGDLQDSLGLHPKQHEGRASIEPAVPVGAFWCRCARLFWRGGLARGGRRAGGRGLAGVRSHGSVGI